ncbi:TIGR03757 family integrating conjugative element protein [Burkholderia multivorans]|uniref:TIGR03757 family integrating conjugative element protein n=1 Tax=Burkholderia multivorans TaxID=87883 RepID=UPI001C96448C|nr:TIGR03757 family integrating conjugative element protein [Burkholderia multivorans]MBY4674354.1 TIGR03757 family integrating conjugative element protein [Burkholderia multivorans]
MSVFLPRFAPGWRTLGLAVALPAALAAFSPATFAADVLVITDSHHPVKAMGGERLIELDESVRIEAELSASLPADPDQAALLVRQRLSRSQGDLQRRLGRAYQDVADAWGLGIIQIPAVVVDRRFVVYGEPDVARAVTQVNAYRSARP